MFWVNTDIPGTLTVFDTVPCRDQLGLESSPPLWFLLVVVMVSPAPLRALVAQRHRGEVEPVVTGWLVTVGPLTLTGSTGVHDNWGWPTLSVGDVVALSP